MVVNKALPLVPGDYAPTDLVVVGGYEVRAALADPLSRMLAAAAAEGVGLELRSGFRSAAYQEQVHADWTGRLGEPRADEVSARPGHSEHQTGLAVDVGSSSAPACDFEACFEQTAEGRWVAARAGEFGFLVRYTAANQAVTGYAPEGWHLRYVGTDLVAEMRARGVTTLEELFGLPGGPDYR
ncbi:D-alanyl-D-alanine carboxypeptidase family protein [Cellulomonas triticagri]|uniref:D-alanyl-D-alanine carboxypeptidase family protein n=1 Tax=Cellulomonas triticagri TaxID=2483352 RepID=A0A3M2IYR1_9CELL|nr:D-alanyl-D-alanine carboxypeptidase family protein [Cellulomonas triticagri]